MKSILIMTAILFLATLYFVFAGINQRMPVSLEQSVLRDITDSLLSQPNAREIIGKYHFSGSQKWSGARFSYGNLSDVSYNQPKTVLLEPANHLLSNELVRNNEVRLFMDSVSHIIADAQRDSVGKAYSSIYFPLATELERLNKSNAERKIIDVYSDLMQNDFSVSLYQPDELQLIKTNPGYLKEVLEKQKSLPSLTGIEIYLIYQPEDQEQDRDWRLVSEFYKKLFEEKGAAVHISANLINQ
jgi:hypothetical protein